MIKRPVNYRALEAAVKTWQQKQKEGPLDPAYAPSIVPAPTLAAPSDQEYGRRAALWRATRRGSRSYDGFTA